MFAWIKSDTNAVKVESVTFARRSQVNICEGCGIAMKSGRKHKKTCSAKCRKRLSRKCA